MFDEAGSVYELHREEANKITLRAYKDINAIVQGSPDGIGNSQTANKVGVVLRRWGEEMHALGMTAGGGAVASLWERHPKAMEALGRSLEHFKTVAEDTGEGSRKLFDDVKQTVCTHHSSHVVFTHVPVLIGRNSACSRPLVRAGEDLRHRKEQDVEKTRGTAQVYEMITSFGQTYPTLYYRAHHSVNYIMLPLASCRSISDPYLVSSDGFTWDPTFICRSGPP